MYPEIASPDRVILTNVQLSLELLGYRGAIKARGITIHFKAPVSAVRPKEAEFLPPTLLVIFSFFELLHQKKY